MPKINVSISETVLTELDKAAQESKMSRSAFLSEAVRHLLDERETEQRLAKRKEAAATMDRIREKFGGWDGTREVLEWREKH